MKKRKFTVLLSVLIFTIVLFAFTGCSDSSAGPADAGQNKEEPSNQKTGKEIPTLNVGWGNELHTGNMHLSFIKPELFENNPVHLKPINDTQLELIKDGEVIAYINYIYSKSGAEGATLLNQGHADIIYGSSTAMINAYDAGAEISILGPVQSGGVSVVAAADAPYDTFEELVEYAKESDMPIMGGYHSAVSSPRIVLEYALRDAGVTITEDSADYTADVFLMDLKGTSNLIPALSSGQVELWAGPVPNPQNAEALGIGKIIAKLDELPGGKWVDFPCCTMNARKAITEQYPEIVQAMVQVTSDISDFAQNNREETAELMTEINGLEKEVLMQNDTTYKTEITEHFTGGMVTYLDVMSQMGKITGRLKDKPAEDFINDVFDFTFVENLKK